MRPPGVRRRAFLAAALCILALSAAAPVGVEAAASPSSAMIACVPALKLSSPPVPLGPGIATAPAPAPCPRGEVPRVSGRTVPKDKPPATEATQIPPYPGYWYAAERNYTPRGTAGTAASLTQHRPHLAPDPAAGHSLAEIAVQAFDGNQIVEVGWTVDRQLNGDDNPHLFVSYWVNGVPHCCNSGLVQLSAWRYPSMPVSITTTPQDFAIGHFVTSGDAGNGWWIRYQNDWVGYFPDELWRRQGVGFVDVAEADWFGEVYAGNVEPPCSQMGNGRLGTATGGAAMADIVVIDNGYNESLAGLYPPTVTNPNYYNVGSTAIGSFRYGGPGGCVPPYPTPDPTT
jgi:hypothetical protein